MEDTGRPPGAEYKIGSCIVRIHGAPDRETLKDATAGFLKAVQRNKMQAGKEWKRGDSKG